MAIDISNIDFIQTGNEIITCDASDRMIFISGGHGNTVFDAEWGSIGDSLALSAESESTIINTSLTGSQQ